jgi:hypothetical protein
VSGIVPLNEQKRKKKFEFREKLVSVRSNGSGEMAAKMGQAEVLWRCGGGTKIVWW